MLFKLVKMRFKKNIWLFYIFSFLIKGDIIGKDWGKRPKKKTLKEISFPRKPHTNQPPIPATRKLIAD